MHLNRASVLFATGLLAGGLSFAAAPPQSKTQSSMIPREITTNTTRQTPSGTSTWHKVAVVGKVRSFTAGQSLEVNTPKGYKKFDLSAKNTIVKGAQNVKVGELVRVIQGRHNGRTWIHIAPFTPGTMRTDTTGAAMRTYFGTVTSYEAGESLNLHTFRGYPKKFNLSRKNVSVQGAQNLKTGERVKVTERQENGKTTIDVMPYTASNAAMHHMKKSW